MILGVGGKLNVLYSLLHAKKCPDPQQTIHFPKEQSLLHILVPHVQWLDPFWVFCMGLRYFTLFKLKISHSNGRGNGKYMIDIIKPGPSIMPFIFLKITLSNQGKMIKSVLHVLGNQFLIFGSYSRTPGNASVFDHICCKYSLLTI